MSVPSFDSGLIDRRTKNFSSLEIEFDNLSDAGNATFPFTALEAGQNLEDAFVLIYCYSPDAADAVTVWQGWTRGRHYDGREKKFILSASFFFESFDLSIPNTLIQQKGFSLNESSGKTEDETDQDPLYIPSVYGVTDFKIKPIIYNHWVEGQTLKVEFILSGIQSGLPFNAGDVTAAQFKLRGSTPASVVEFYPGNQVAAPVNLTRFPENQIHPLVAFGYAEFPITDANKNAVDNLGPQDIKARIGNGKVLLATGVASENPVRILQDILQDSIYGLGLPATAFDSTAITNAANYVGTRYQAIYELTQPIAVIDLVQRILGDCHCYMTFENGLIQISAKKNTETSAITFATSDSGVVGRKIDGDFVDVEVKDSSELTNQVTIQFRTKKHARRIVTLYDPTAQAHAGGSTKKVVEEKVDMWDTHGLYDETQCTINAAITLRENQNANLYGTFASPIWDCLDIVPGDVVAVRSVDKFNDAANKDVRIIKKSIDTAANTITFGYQIYKQAVYNDDATALGVDLLRGGEDVSIPGRPPDVAPVSVTIQDVVTSDTEGTMANIRALFTVPTYDAAIDAADGIFHEPPIQEVQVYWNWADESVENARLGGSIAIRQQATNFNAYIDFQTDYRKSKSIIVYFLSIAPNRSRSRIGWIPDPLKVSSLTANLATTAAAASVVSSALFTVGDTIIIEREILILASKASSTLTFNNTAGVRNPFYNTTSIAHPSGTEIAVAKLSYPALVLSFAAPRFNYPIVAGLTAVSQGDRVDLKWTDISAENRENYLVYWSTDADALSNPAKLGVANPTWYAANPLSPPAGVNLSINDDLKHKILQSEIGGPNVVVRARIAARNGKNNYSTSLSASASASSSGSTVPDNAAPNNGTPITVNSAKLHAGGNLSIHFQLPTVQMNTFDHIGLQLHDNNATGAGRRYWDAYAVAWVSAYPDPLNEMHYARGGVPGLRISPVDIFVGGRTQFYCVIKVWNQFNGGTFTSSPDLPAAGFGLITQSGSGADLVPTDTAVPTLASPSAPDVQDADGKLLITCPEATANTHTIKRTYVVMSTQNTSPANFTAPTVGVSGVVKIKRGRTPTFRPLRPQPGTLYFYYCIENDFGISGWSTGTSLVGTAITRPGEDIIGNDVPRLPFGLQRVATSAASPANTGNTYYLDAGASSEVGIYIGMSVHLTSVGAVNRFRQITAYDEVLKKITVSPSWTVVPANSTPFEIHRGTVLNSRANQAGSVGQTTATFILDSGASNVDGTYNGWFLWIPGSLLADSIRQITAYTGSTRACTVDVAFSVAQSPGIAYFITQGNMGYTSAAASVGSSASPIRAWIDSVGSFNQLEIILTQGDNAYSLTHFQIQVATGAGQVKHDEVVPLTSAPIYNFAAVNAGRAARVRFRNLYRGNGASDGWSSWSDWVAVPRSTATTQAYAPDVYFPVVVDYEYQLPGGKYVAY